MTKHTPGPWEYKGGKVLSRTSPHAGLVAHIYEKGNLLWDKNNIEPVGWSDTAQRDANAHLIAAAPDLLAALKGLMAWCAGDVLNVPEVNAARDAVAKAEGNSRAV